MDRKTTDRQTDLQLLAEWRQGNVEAGNRLFRRHFDSVYRFFVNKVGTDFDDLVQATFLGCVEGVHRFRCESSFRTYLFQVARFKLYSHYERRGRDPVALPTTSVAAMGISPSGHVAGKQEEALLLEALQDLPLDMQVAVELYYWEGLTLGEIASVLEQPLNTVATRIRRARERLLAQLTKTARQRRVAAAVDEAQLERWARELRDRLSTS